MTTIFHTPVLTTSHMTTIRSRNHHRRLKPSKISFDGGHYLIHEPIGIGSAGIVYGADFINHDHSDPGVRLALKIMRRGSTEADTGRFLNEIILLNNLDSAHITKMLGCGIISNEDSGVYRGLYYMATEFVDGCDLYDLLKQHPKLPLTRTLLIAHSMCDALGHAHSRKIIHRDTNPRNIMIAGGPKKIADVKLIDFGIASLSEIDGYDIATTAGIHAPTRVVCGTVGYLSPEQIRARAASSPEDVWALGICMYGMLTGKLPFRCENLIEYSFATRGDPVPISDLNDDVPAGFARIIHQCIKPDPDERPQSMEELDGMLTDCEREKQIYPVAFGSVIEEPGSNSAGQTISIKLSKSDKKWVAAISALCLVLGTLIALVMHSCENPISQLDQPNAVMPVNIEHDE